jgi:hypothetical protein
MGKEEEERIGEEERRGGEKERRRGGEQERRTGGEGHEIKHGQPEVDLHGGLTLVFNPPAVPFLPPPLDMPPLPSSFSASFAFLSGLEDIARHVIDAQMIKIFLGQMALDPYGFRV